MSTTSVESTTNTKVFQFRFPSRIRGGLQLFIADLLFYDVLKHYDLLVSLESKVTLYTKRRGDNPTTQVSTTFYLVTLTGHIPGEQDRRLQDFPSNLEFAKYIKYLVKD